MTREYQPLFSPIHQYSPFFISRTDVNNDLPWLYSQSSILYITKLIHQYSPFSPYQAMLTMIDPYQPTLERAPFPSPKQHMGQGVCSHWMAISIQHGLLHWISTKMQETYGNISFNCTWIYAFRCMYIYIYVSIYYVMCTVYIYMYVYIQM